MLWQARQGLIAGRGALDAAAAGGGGGPVTFAYIGGVSPTYAGNVATATSASIGTAASDRLVVVIFYDFNSGAASSTASVTIGGSAATLNTHTDSTTGNFTGIASLVVPSGTTATIAVTYGNTAGGFGSFQIYTLKGLSSTTATGAGQAYDRTNTDPLTITTNIATTSGGVIVAGGLTTGPGTIVTNAGSTETFTQDINPLTIAGSTFGFASHATGVATNASSVVNAVYDWSPGFTSFTLVAAAWR